MDEETERKIRRALLLSWSAETSYCFSKDNAPSYGQCAQTAIVIQDHFGGEILRTDGWPQENGARGRHFYNRIGGKRYDFTAGQFSEMSDYTCDIQYKDLASSAEEAATEAKPSQVEAMREAFAKAIGAKRKDNKQVVRIFGLDNEEADALD